MKKPAPEVGLVIRYDYLWHDEAMKGREEGAKDRPCAVIQRVEKTETGGHTVLVAPITHTPPSGQNEGVEIPHRVTKHLGLDDQPQWIKTTEVNRVSWDDAGITPATKKQWAYGRLPKGLYDQAKKSIQQNARVRKAQIVKREVAEKKENVEERGNNRGRGRGQER
jgi:uncharacterized protein YifN (PemK superfamily)